VIESYAFLAAFAAQILVASVLFPIRFIRYARGWATNFASERFAELYPGVDYRRSMDRFITAYRAVNIVIALAGVALFFWLSTLAGKQNWVETVSTRTLNYFLIQFAPLILLSLFSLLFYRKILFLRSQEVKRKATLRRRGLFDFVSPLAFFASIASYVLFVIYAVWLDLHVYRNASLSWQCWTALGGVTFTYAVNALLIYRFLYGRKNPLVTNEGREHMIGARVKAGVYTSMTVAWFVSLVGTLGQAGMQDWKPFALSMYFVAMTLLTLIDVSPPRKPDALDPAPAA
jgi:MFS family permease